MGARTSSRNCGPARASAIGLSLLLLAAGRAGAQPVASSQTIIGNRPYLTILCQFSDWTGQQLVSRERYARWMEGNQYPSFQHFWTENSYGRLTFHGSRTVGWVTLPEERAAYYATRSDGTPDLNAPNFDKLLRQCTALVDDSIDFRQFAAVNIALNGVIAISHGTWMPIFLDGQNRFLPVTYLASALNAATVAHEVGHTLEFSHSLGENGTAANWDPMSGGWWVAAEQDLIPSHTIAYHKDIAGWIDANRRFETPPASIHEIELAPLANPGTQGVIYGIVRTPADSVWYTVEARKRSGPYESLIPHEGVLIHRVDRRTPHHAPTRLIDGDGDGDYNDEGAVWTAGEVFSDSINGIVIEVLSATDDGYRVRLRRGWRLRLEVTGNGEVRGALNCSGGNVCDRLFGSTQDVVLTAHALDSSVFVGWRIGCAAIFGDCRFNIGEDRTVNAVFAPSIISSTSERPRATIGARYRDQLRIIEWLGPASWLLESGELPPGLQLSNAGLIEGVPQAAGTYRARVRVSAGEHDAAQEIAITVAAPSLSPEAVFRHLAGATAQLTADEQAFLDFVGNGDGVFDIGDFRAWLRSSYASRQFLSETQNTIDEHKATSVR